MVESGKKWVKNSDFSPSNHLKIGEKFIQNRQNSQKIHLKTFLKGGAELAGAILKGRAAGSSWPPICRSWQAVAVLIGAALLSLKVAAGRWQAVKVWQGGGAGCLSYMVWGGRRWWAAAYLLYSSKMGKEKEAEQATRPALPLCYVVNVLRSGRSHRWAA